MKKLACCVLLLAMPCPLLGQSASAKYIGFHDKQSGMNCSTDPGYGGSSDTSCASSNVRIYTVETDTGRLELEESNMKDAIPYAHLFTKHGPLSSESPGGAVIVTMDGSFAYVANGKGKGYRYRVVAATAK